MWLLDRLAEERIAEARDRGDLDDLPNAGKSLHLEDDAMVPPELRAAYRVLKNAGYLPEEIVLRRQVHDAEELLRLARTEEKRATAGARLRLLLARLGGRRGASLALQDAYFLRVRDRIQHD